MRTRSLLINVCLMVCLASVGLAQAVPEYVYFSNGESVYRFDPEICSGDVTCLQEVLYVPDAEFGGVNHGPDELLYWCDPANGRAGRLDPNDYGAVPLSLVQTEVFWDFAAASGPGPEEPQCGWFNHLGGFAVSNRAGPKVWLFQNLADYGPQIGGTPFDPGVNLVTPTAILNTETAGLEGLTQDVAGNLLVVVPGGSSGPGKGKGGGSKGSVLSAQFPFFLPSYPPAVVVGCEDADPFCGPLVADLSKPQGVVMGNGFIFVSDDKQIQVFDSMGGFKGTCAAFQKDTPTLLAATVNGTLFVGTVGKKEGKVYSIDFSYRYDPVSETTTGDCTEPVLLQTLAKNEGFRPAVTGVTVTPTSETVAKSYDDGDFVQVPPGSGRYEAPFQFNGSNIWELSAGPGCTTSIEAFLTPPAKVQNAIQAITLDENGDPHNPLEDSVPVTFFGDNGYSWIWRLDSGDLTGEPDAACPPGPPAPPSPDPVYRYLSIAYAPFLPNGRIGVCSDAGNPASCAFIELTISVGVNQSLTTRDPLGGRRRSGSDYFWVDQGTDGSGVWCGFESPLTNTTDGEPPAEFDVGDNIPIKGRLAKVTGANPDGSPIFDCQNGPFIREMGTEDNPIGPLLSVAKIDPVTGAVLEVLKQLFPNGNGQQEPAYFDSLQNATGQWHYNLSTSSGFDKEAHYELWVAFPLDDTAVAVTEIVFRP